MKKNINDRMADAIKEMRIDRKLGYEIPAEVYAQMHDIPYEVDEPDTEAIKRYDELTEEERKDFIEVDGKKYIRKLYEQNQEKPTIGYIRGKYHMNIKQISDRFEIPYRTVQNWCNGSRECPAYILKMMDEILSKEQ